MAKGASHDIILPVQRGSADLAPSSPCSRWKACCAPRLPGVFTARYSLTVVSADNREVFSNSSVKPTDRQLTGAINIELPNNRLGLNIVAYRGRRRLAAIPAGRLIIALTLIASVTLVQLRRHARRRAATEEELRAAYAFRQAMSNSLITGLRPSISTARSPSSMRLLPDDRLQRERTDRHPPPYPLLAG